MIRIGTAFLVDALGLFETISHGQLGLGTQAVPR
jgi:hypothetical protein